MYYNYILKLNNGYFYKGFTDNLERRLNEHFSGHVNSTKKYLPFKLIYVELTSNRANARKLEKYFKSGAGREIIWEIDDWPGC